MDEHTISFVGTSATDFATECGITMHNFCPMNYHTWELVPEDAKTLMSEKLEVSWKIRVIANKYNFYGVCECSTHAQWKRTRGKWSEHWKKNGGKTNPQLARSKRKFDCPIQEWNHLCDYWELEKTKKYSDKMEANRAKQVISRRGSRSIANHTFQMINPETQIPPSPLEVYHKLHFNATKQGWLNENSRIEYENIIEHKQAALDELNSKGITITTTMEHQLEKEAIKSVCGRKKTIQSAWEVGVGPVLRKKDSWMKSVAESSQRDSSENESLRSSYCTRGETETG
ncbi:putative transposase, Ptta/En/Spm, plant [Helianthus anomalus]